MPTLRPYLALRHQPPKQSQHHRTLTGNGHFTDQFMSRGERGEWCTEQLPDNSLEKSLICLQSFTRQLPHVSFLLFFHCSPHLLTSKPVILIPSDSKRVQPTREEQSPRAALCSDSNHLQGPCPQSKELAKVCLPNRYTQTRQLQKAPYELLQPDGEVDILIGLRGRD